MKKKRSKMQWKREDDLQQRINQLVIDLRLEHVDVSRVFMYRTYGATARAYARIWAFPKIFQEVLEVAPAYVIEVLSEKFDKLSDENKTKVLIHELLHIPKNFSGALAPHKTRARRIDREVDRLYKEYKKR